MKTTQFLRIAISTLVLSGFVVTAMAQVQPDRPRSGKKMEKMRKGGSLYMQIPDLTEEQQEQIQSIMLDIREQMLPIQNQMREKRARLRTLSTGTEVDAKAAESVIEEIGDLRTQMMKERFASRQEIRTLLTDEQKVWFDSRSHRFMQKRMQRGNR
jgi:Spy/CpxP family protein refolding chaperone